MCCGRTPTFSKIRNCESKRILRLLPRLNYPVFKRTVQPCPYSEQRPTRHPLSDSVVNFEGSVNSETKRVFGRGRSTVAGAVFSGSKEHTLCDSRASRRVVASSCEQRPRNEERREDDLSAFSLTGGEPQFRGFPQGSPNGTLFENILFAADPQVALSSVVGILTPVGWRISADRKRRMNGAFF